MTTYASYADDKTSYVCRFDFAEAIDILEPNI